MSTVATPSVLPSSIRVLFLTVGLGLVAQYVLVGIVNVRSGAEPWPTVVLPGFKKVYDASDTITVPDVGVTIYFNRGQASVSPPAFLAMMPRSHSVAFFRAQCAPASDSSSPVVPACQMPDGRKWFVQRAQALFPERRVRGVDVVWSHLHFVPRSHSLTRVPMDTLRIHSPIAFNEHGRSSSADTR